MAVGDAIQALDVEHFAPWASYLLSWNARYFQQKLVVSALTPKEWLMQHRPSTARSLFSIGLFLYHYR